MGQRADARSSSSRGAIAFTTIIGAQTVWTATFSGDLTTQQEFIRVQDQVGDDEWLDDIWAEGGAVLDRDRSALLFFGGEDVRYDVPLRRLYLKSSDAFGKDGVSNGRIPGSSISPSYVGSPRERVMAEVRDSRRSTWLGAPREAGLDRHRRQFPAGGRPPLLVPVWQAKSVGICSAVPSWPNRVRGKRPTRILISPR